MSESAPIKHPWHDHPLRQGGPPAWADAWGEDDYGPWVETDIKGVVQRWRWMPEDGSFQMGSPDSEVGRYEREGPRHLVTLTRGFWMADTPCTQALWVAVMDDNPSEFQGGQRPVERVTWNRVQEFLAKLSAREPAIAADAQPRLPTEAEWEYACRATTPEATYHGDLRDESRDALLDDIAWYAGNADGKTHDVAQLRPSSWGLYDTLGNVLEWCVDGPRKYSAAGAVNPLGPPPSAAQNAAVRGGAWFDDARAVRAAYRSGDPPSDSWNDVGFRLARGQGDTSLPAEPAPRWAEPTSATGGSPAEPAGSGGARTGGRGAPDRANSPPAPPPVAGDPPKRSGRQRPVGRRREE